MKYGYVYITTDLRNNLKYIGQKKGTFDPNYFGSGLLISRKIKKHGTEFFKVKCITTASTKKKLDELEIYWIKRKKSLWPKGYNLAECGLGGNTWEGRHHTEESKEKNRQKHLGKEHSTLDHKQNCKCFCCKAERGEFRGKNNHMSKHTGKKNHLYGVRRWGKDNPNYVHGKYVKKQTGGE